MCSTAPRRRAPPPAWPRGSCRSAVATGFQSFPWSWNRQHRFRPIPAKTSRRVFRSEPGPISTRSPASFSRSFRAAARLVQNLLPALAALFLAEPWPPVFRLRLLLRAQTVLDQTVLAWFPALPTLPSQKAPKLAPESPQSASRQHPVRFERRLPAQRPAVYFQWKPPARTKSQSVPRLAS